MTHGINRSGQEHGNQLLSALLKAWSAPGPQQDFEAAVWRRIAADAPATGREGTPGWFLRGLATQRAWTSALATAGAVAVGLWMGLSAPRVRDHQPAPRAILGDRTAAGAYLSMAAGDVR